MDLYEPLLEQLKAESASPPRIFENLTGWDRVDRQTHEIRRELAGASAEEHFQKMGLLCRETLISLAQSVYDPVRHASLDGVEFSPTDAKRMLDAYVASELSGSSNEAARRLTKATIDLANELVHRRTADFRLAALCAEATVSAVSLIAVLAGRRAA